MLDPVDHHPPIVCASMSGAVNFMNARHKLFGVGEERLAIGKDCNVCGCRNFAVEIVVGYHLYQFHPAVGHRNAQWDDLVIAVTTPVLGP